MTAAAWRTSAGAAAHLPIARATNLNRSLRAYADAGLTLIGLDGKADTSIDQVAGASGPLVLIVGSEGSGLSRLVREACDVIASVPISAQVESLNAGVSRPGSHSMKSRGSVSVGWTNVGGARLSPQECL